MHMRIFGELLSHTTAGDILDGGFSSGVQKLKEAELVLWERLVGGQWMDEKNVCSVLSVGI